MDQFTQLSRQIGQALMQRNLRLATAESCTGGWVSEVITQTSGSSGWFDRGFVAYSNQAKIDMLGVSEKVLTTCGAVSEEAALAMALGALAHSQADISLAVTGIAGPDGGTVEKPVGLVWFAWAGKVFPPIASPQQFAGDRSQIRVQAVIFVLQTLLRQLELVST
jgi:nicotinamide-nucleotide amidase